jgi:hypothetical protein
VVVNLFEKERCDGRRLVQRYAKDCSKKEEFAIADVESFATSVWYNIY